MVFVTSIRTPRSDLDPYSDSPLKIFPTVLTEPLGSSTFVTSHEEEETVWLA